MASQYVVSLFEEARERVRGEIDSIVESLNGKREGLLAEIGALEREFLDMQRQRQKDINKLNTLISHTEELGQNTLLSVQQRVKQELHQEIDRLKLKTVIPDFTVSIQWGFSKDILINHVNNSKIGKVLTTVPVKIEADRDSLTSSPLPDVLWDHGHMGTDSVSCEDNPVSCEDNPVSSSPGGSPVVEVHIPPEDIGTEDVGTSECSLGDTGGSSIPPETEGSNAKRIPLAPSRREFSHRDPSRDPNRRYFDYEHGETHEQPRGERKEHNTHSRGHNTHPMGHNQHSTGHNMHHLAHNTNPRGYNQHPRGHRREYTHPRGGSRRDMDREYNKYREY